ncbi:SDR family NAD(P)-dependent oxidoreductase [uncultured Methylobacterium sp.]|uniref:SDR family NAD(P)-dependent oxidoreductase n=1 Tax=uncultured Methylobacterium sp. TaxID=157278 RepID=UPI0035CAF788
MRCVGRIALVTGGDSGIGAATAEALAREGADVALTYLHDADGAVATARAVEAAGRRALAVRSDAADPDAVAALFARVEAELGPPDALVNNAGLGQGGTPLAEMTDEGWDAVIRTDLTAPFYMARAFVRLRRRHGGGGRIVNVTSVHESVPCPGAIAYGAAKGGLRMITRTLALEVAPDRITVNSVAPGLTDTPMTASQIHGDPSEREKEFSAIPLGRPAWPGEIGRLVVYLVSRDADYVTGQSFVVDGGLSINVGQGA